MVQLKSKNIVYFGVFISLLFLSSSVYAIDISVVTSIFSSVTATISSFFVSVPIAPVINTAYLDKQKYMPGEQMIVTASVSDVESVVAYIETEIGVDEVPMILVTGTKEEGTWQVAWTLHDTLTKEYYTKIVAVSDDGLETEIILKWFDPTVSHLVSEIIFDDNLDVGSYNITTSGRITIAGGNPGVNKVLTSDATGLSSWQSLPSSSVPSGVIVMWSGLIADIPTGWDLADGNGGRPNLTSRFVRGADDGVEAGTIGGSESHSHSMLATGVTGGGGVMSWNTDARSNRPPYYDVLFIMKL